MFKTSHFKERLKNEYKKYHEKEISQSTIIIEEILNVYDKDMTESLRETEAIIRKNPNFIDAYLANYSIWKQYSDSHTYISALRELLSIVKPSITKETDGIILRSYLRLLEEIGDSGGSANRLDIQIYAYEECLRIDRDCVYTNITSKLISCYMKVIGRKRRNIETFINRTNVHLKAILDRYNTDYVVSNIYNLASLYNKYITWKNMAKSKLSKEEEDFLHSIRERYEAEESGKMEENPNFITYTLVDLPDFVIFLNNISCNKPDPVFITFARRAAERVSPKRTEKDSAERAENLKNVLEDAREKLKKKQVFKEVLLTMVNAIDNYASSVVGNSRWYKSQEFAVTSNAALAALNLQYTHLARIYVRYALVMPNGPTNKNKKKLFEIRQNRVADELQSNELIKKSKEIAEMSRELNDENDDHVLARKCNALLSLRCFIASNEGRLTEDVIKQAESDDIDDLYYPIRLGTDVFPMLPWIDESDLKDVALF